ncbi:TPA: hypothetical protein HA231_04860 [Candidatus Woesearchaeota archaeon]|nr:hypothetical protein [Candidatus Woesearchaeota archaeon]
MVNAIVTMPPYAPYLREVLAHPIVSGIRFNTVMPVRNLEETVKQLAGEAATQGKELWVDLKCRQLRIRAYAVPPFTEIELTHNISVDPGARAYFSDGRESATVVAANGNKLIMLEGPKRVVGPGESVSIPHPSLKVEGYLTDTDKQYVEAGLRIGLHNYLLSFVEGSADIEGIKRLDPAAAVIEKIESLAGLNYVENEWHGGRLMAARGDLYMQVSKPHHMLRALEQVISKDKNAVVASRIFPSLVESLEPSCQDIGDVDNLLRMGYRTFMFGDDICFRRDSIMSGLNLLRAVAERYEK